MGGLATNGRRVFLLLLLSLGMQGGFWAFWPPSVGADEPVSYRLTDYQEPGVETPGVETPSAEPSPVPEAEPLAEPPTELFEQPATIAPPPPAPLSSLLSQLDEIISPERAAGLGGGTGANIVLGAETAVLGSTDTGDLLTSSVFNTGVYARYLSPVMTDTRVRGYRFSEIRTTLDGAAWFPVRPDADTPLSRFDSNIVQDVAIIRGPYNVRLGPGFAFIDVALRQTPRHPDGFQWAGETSFAWDSNGAQWSGRQSFEGGGWDRGWRVGYGHRGGSDFTAGDDLPLAASFNVRDWDFAYGLDFEDESTLEFSYIRTEMTDVELPGQVNDFRFLISDGFGLRYSIDDQPLVDRFSINGWYNLTNFSGNADNKTFDPANPDLFVPPPPPMPPAPTFTDNIERVSSFGDTSSAGMRMLASWGDPEFDTFAIGADMTFLRQAYFERREDNGVIDFGVPDAREDDAGLFFDGRRMLNDQLTLKVGGRIDFVQTDAKPNSDVDARVLALQTITPPPSLICAFTPCEEIDVPQNFTLGAGYLSTEYELDDTLTLNGGIGYAERAPSPTDLYADLPHLSIMQEGAFFIPHGNLRLKKEKALQADLGLTMRYEYFRGGVSVFYTEVYDFITYTAPHLDPPSGPHEIHAIGTNTDARMAGGELYGELDLTDPLTAFATLSYVQGKDFHRDEPLWGIPPLDTRLGLRLQDTQTELWGLEYIIRVVDNQDRVSSVGFVGEQPTAGFTTHDVRGYYMLSDTAVLIAGIENLGDAFYREHLDTRLDLTLGADPARGIVRRGASFYLALQAEY